MVAERVSVLALAGMTLPWGLDAFGQIMMRRIDGYEELPLTLQRRDAA